MSLSNPWFLAAVIGLAGWFHLKLFVDLLNLSRLGQALPESLRGLMSDEERARATEYHTARAKLGVIEDAVMLAATFGFWMFGGFGWLDRWVMQLGLGGVAASLV